MRDWSADVCPSDLCACLEAAGAAIACPDVTILEDEAGNSDCDGSAELQSLGQALEQLTYLALERHHPGWEINDGACGELVIDVAEATFVLDCSLRLIATEEHSTETYETWHGPLLLDRKSVVEGKSVSTR